jgi:hypothetical protein
MIDFFIETQQDSPDLAIARIEIYYNNILDIDERKRLVANLEQLIKELSYDFEEQE